jgi:hypothetical protein
MRRRPHWPQSRAGGCLLWILILIALLIVLSVMFGGFQKGSKSGGMPAELSTCHNWQARALSADVLGHTGRWCHSA